MSSNAFGYYSGAPPGGISDAVTIDTTQTVTGAKYFTNTLNEFHGTFYGQGTLTTTDTTILGSLAVVANPGGNSGFLTVQDTIHADGDITTNGGMSADFIQLDTDVTAGGTISANDLISTSLDVDTITSDSIVSTSGTFDTLIVNNSTNFGSSITLPQTNVETNYGISASISLIVKDTVSQKYIGFLPNNIQGGLNNICSIAGDSVIAGLNSTQNQPICLTSWSTTKTGVRVEANNTRMCGGVGEVYVDGLGISLSNVPSYHSHNADFSQNIQVNGAAYLNGATYIPQLYSTNTVNSGGITTNTFTGDSVYVSQDIFIGANNTFSAQQSNQRVGIRTGNPSEALEVIGNIKISGNNNALIFADGTSISTAPAGPTGSLTGETLTLSKTNPAISSSILANHVETIEGFYYTQNFNVFLGGSDYFIPTTFWNPESGTNGITLSQNSNGSNSFTGNFSYRPLNDEVFTCPYNNDYSRAVLSSSQPSTDITAYKYLYNINVLDYASANPPCSWDTYIDSYDPATLTVHFTKPMTRGFTNKVMVGQTLVFNVTPIPTNGIYTLYYINFPLAQHKQSNYWGNTVLNPVITSQQNACSISNLGYNNNLNGLSLDCPFFGRNAFPSEEYYGNTPLYSRHNIGFTIKYSCFASSYVNGFTNNFGNPKDVLTFITSEHLYAPVNNTQFSSMSNGVWLLNGYAAAGGLEIGTYFNIKLSWGAPSGGVLVNSAQIINYGSTVTVYPANYTNCTDTDSGLFTGFSFPQAIVVMTNGGINTQIYPLIEAKTSSGGVYTNFVITATRIA